MQNSVYEAQVPVRALYKTSPESAMVTDHAMTGGAEPADPFHTQVYMKAGAGAPLAVGVHGAVGGPYDAPCPGDLLCAALAACQDSSVRLVANLMGIELTALTVEVKATADIRGAMGLDRDVPVGFQSMSCDVRFKAREGTPAELLEKLRVAAERCCVVAQTLRAPLALQTTFTADLTGSG